MKMRFHSHVNLTHFHMNGCAPGFALKERLKVTRKWAIVMMTRKWAIAMMPRNLFFNSQQLEQSVRKRSVTFMMPFC